MKGTVFTGEGEASEFLEISEYRHFIQEKTGFEPFPGTLNLKVDPDSAEALMEDAKENRMEEFERNGDKFGGLTLYHIELEGLKCCVIDPDITRYDQDVIEVCSSEKLRERLDLEDGDKVEIRSGSESISEN